MVASGIALVLNNLLSMPSKEKGVLVLRLSWMWVSPILQEPYSAQLFSI